MSTMRGAVVIVITDGEKPFGSVLKKLRRIKVRESRKLSRSKRTNHTLSEPTVAQLITDLKKKSK